MLFKIKSLVKTNLIFLIPYRIKVFYKSLIKRLINQRLKHLNTILNIDRQITHHFHLKLIKNKFIDDKYQQVLTNKWTDKIHKLILGTQ